MTLGYDSLEAYLEDHPYFGVTIGRFGNRIAAGTFSLDGQTYRVPINNGPNALHGGPEGFDKKVWAAAVRHLEAYGDCLVMRCVSPDGEMGFPGTLHVAVTFVWQDDNALRIEYEATTDAPTVVNLTNHAYFTLGATGNVLAQELRLDCDRFVPIDATGIPTGQLAEVANTPFDFRTAKAIGRDIRAGHPQLTPFGGYDHTFVLTAKAGTLRKFAELRNLDNGRKLTAFTTEPGVQVFTANFAPGQFTDRHGKPLPTHAAVCLETQHFPDSPNQPTFPSTRLAPEATYRSVTCYRFE